LFDVEAQVRKIAEIRKIGDRSDVPLVINARTDVLILGQADKSSRLKEAIDRGNAYNNAGADCFFPVGAIDSQTISEITRHVRCPINILATNGVPSVPELKSLGVRRVSVGSGPARATFGLVRKIAHELRESGYLRESSQRCPYACGGQQLGPAKLEPGRTARLAVVPGENHCS